MATLTEKTGAELIAEQQGYAARVKEISETRYGNGASFYVHTYGCQQNVSDSEKLKGWLIKCGFFETDDPSKADIALFNTCAVREHAEERVFGNIGALKRYKKERPDMIIAVCGCMAQQPSVAEKIKMSYPYVDILFGTAVRHRLPEFLYRRMTGSSRVFELGGENRIIEGSPIKRDGSFKYWLPVMQGCDNFCTYCIVPYVRGRECSRNPDSVIAEAKELVNSGAKEIMLLGQNVNSYGKGLEGDHDFAELLYRVNDIKGDFRIRFMTSHPKDCSERLLTAMRDCEKVCRVLHLPVQSGSDRILTAMNRRYDTARYLSLIGTARSLMPDIKFTSDIIVGFPGETYEDFKETLSLIEKVRYRALFTFIFSPRKGTPAAKLDDPVPKEEKSKWFSELLRVQDGISASLNRELEGKTVRVLAEEKSGDILSGKDEAGATVLFRGGDELIGEFSSVRITDTEGTLKGDLI